MCSMSVSALTFRPCRMRRLRLDYSGIRPKLTGPGEPAADFLIEAPAQHGVPDWCRCSALNRRGSTSSLSLAGDEVVKAIDA